MDTRTISMGGAAWLASSIAGFASKSDFVKEQLKGIAFISRGQDVRVELLGQVWDLAVKNHPDLFPVPETENKKKK